MHFSPNKQICERFHQREYRLRQFQRSGLDRKAFWLLLRARQVLRGLQAWKPSVGVLKRQVEALQQVPAANCYQMPVELIFYASAALHPSLLRVFSKVA